MLRSGKGMLRSAVLAALLASFLISTALADTLGPGSREEAVVTLKAELNEKGYYTKKDTSKHYTSSLKSAVSVFQIANNIPEPVEGYGYADAETQVRAASDDAVLYADYIQDKQLQPGGSGSYVTKAQKRLNKLGYYSGKIDGKYRSSTVAAVKYFEKANSLVEDGIADRDTRNVLYSSDAKTRARYEEENNLTPLSFGAKGGQVVHLQNRLYELGFYWGKQPLGAYEPSGVYDSQTKYSVKFFQEANGYNATGSVSRTLRAKLNSESVVSYEDYLKANQNIELVQLSSSAKPGLRVAVLQRQLQKRGYYKGVITGAYSSSVITAVRTFQIFNNMPSKYVTGKANTETRKLLLDKDALDYDKVCGDDTLKLGSRGAEVTRLKARLKELGYFNGTVNDEYDSVTASALKVFQRYNGFYPSGVAYSNVQAVLYGSSAVAYTNAKIEKLIDVAKDLLGTPYRSPANPPHSFDCSTFTAYCLRKVGVYVTSGVANQAYIYRKDIGRRINITDRKNLKELKKGDLLYFYTPISDKNPKPDKKKGPGHTGIYLGRNAKGQYQFIHASSGKSGKKVIVTDLKIYNERKYGPWFLWAIRIWE